VTQGESTAAAAIRKVSRRLIPFLFVCDVAAWLDRVNVGFAALQMNQALKFSPVAFGLGSGIFFVGYCLFEVPSNLLMHRIGARRWIARIMLSWGVIASAMMFVRTPLQFYALRFLLGVAEAGFFPGIVYYFCNWYPREYRARAIGALMTAIPIAGVVGGPLSGALLGLDGVKGLGGWQWLFLLQGLPSIVLGVCTWFYLIDDPKSARWLTPMEQSALVARITSENLEAQRIHPSGSWAALKNPTIWHLGVIFFLANLGFYAYSIWSPQMIKAYVGATNWMVGVVSGAISAIVILAMTMNCAHSDRTGERVLHVAIPLSGMCLGFLAAASTGESPLAIACLALVPIGIGAAYGPFWSMPGSFLVGEGAASGIAMVNTLANASGFFGPTVVGVLKSQSGGYAKGFVVLGVAAGLAALLTVPLRGTRFFPRQHLKPMPT
jgi:ACS family tartrate transporter-like MFS transporter